jgi:hypothetical protein
MSDSNLEMLELKSMVLISDGTILLNNFGQYVEASFNMSANPYFATQLVNRRCFAML